MRLGKRPEKAEWTDASDSKSESRRLKWKRRKSPAKAIHRARHALLARTNQWALTGRCRHSIAELLRTQELLRINSSGTDIRLTHQTGRRRVDPSPAQTMSVYVFEFVGLPCYDGAVGRTALGSDDRPRSQLVARQAAKAATIAALTTLIQIPHLSEAGS